MSYSIHFKAPTKAEAKWRVGQELEKVMLAQACHADDCRHHLVAAQALLDLMPEDDSRDVQVSMNGSVGWSGEWKPGETRPGALSFGFSAQLVARAPAAA